MAMLPKVFQADKVESSSFDPLVDGWYEAEIIKSSLHETKAKTGKYLKLQFKILGEKGDYGVGRMVFNNLNLVNPNQVAVEIAEKELKSICDACGVEELEDSEELHNIPMGIMLKTRPETTQWPASNEIKRYCSRDELANKPSAQPDAGDSSNPFG